MNQHIRFRARACDQARGDGAASGRAVLGDAAVHHGMGLDALEDPRDDAEHDEHQGRAEQDPESAAIGAGDRAQYNHEHEYGASRNYILDVS